MNTDPLTAEELAVLKAKWEAATQGEWTFEASGDWYITTPKEGTEFFQIVIASGDDYDHGDWMGITKIENGEAIAALHNAFPRFLATLAAKEAELAAWESAVEEMRAHLAAAVGSEEGTNHEGSES